MPTRGRRVAAQAPRRGRWCLVPRGGHRDGHAAGGCHLRPDRLSLHVPHGGTGDIRGMPPHRVDVSRGVWMEGVGRVGKLATSTLIQRRRVIHSFLLFFFICSYADGNRRKSRPPAGHLAPQYPHTNPLWTGARHFTDKAQPLVTPVPLTPGQTTTVVELHQLDERPSPRPLFGLSLHQPTTTTEEHLMLARAMVGLWDEGAESPYLRPLHQYGEAVSRQVDQKSPAMGQYI